MFDELITKIYEMKFGTVITPQNLLSNAKLENYNYVKYEKSQNQFDFVVEMECLCSDSVMRVFKYFFDSADQLQRIITCEPTFEVIFDREEELKSFMNAFREEQIWATSRLAV